MFDLPAARALIAEAHPADAKMACADCCPPARTRTAMATAFPAAIEEIERGRKFAAELQVGALEKLETTRVERDKALADVARLTVTYDNTCSCALADATQLAIKHAKDCPIRVNLRKRISPELAMARLGAALDSGDEVDELRGQLAAMTAARDEACALYDAAVRLEPDVDDGGNVAIYTGAERIAVLRAVGKETT